MTIEEKLKIIDDIVLKENAQIENIGKQSIKITHQCGCVLVEHFLDSNSVIERQTLNKRFFITLCSIHDSKDLIK